MASVKIDSTKRPSYNGKHLEEQLESLRRIAYEMTYATRDYQQKCLLSAEVLKTYVERLLRDGDIGKYEQLNIYENLRQISIFIIDTVNEAAGMMEKSAER